MSPLPSRLGLAAANDTPPDPRLQLIALHQKLFERQRRLIALATVPEGPELVRYRRRYQRHVRTFERPVSYEEVLRQALAADVVYVGDYHTLRQAQRAFEKLAAALDARGRKPVLALEFVQGRYQRQVDAYLDGRLEEHAFLEAIRYRRHQAFDVWGNFRPLFELARARSLRVIALDRPAGGPRSLRERDAFAARALARGHRPGELALVLVGQLHLAPEHLPGAYDRELLALGRPKARRLLLYQNCEEIYWQLERRRLEHQVEAVRIRDDAACLVNTSPLVCQQSYLDWVEATREGELLESWAPAHHFREAALLLGRFLEVDVEAAVDDVRVHAAGDLGFLAELREASGLTGKERRALERRVLSRESFCLPRANAVYLAGASVNHAAEVASAFVWHTLAEDEADERGLVDGFYARALEQALGFFGSKVLNPRRKCRHAREWARQLTAGHARDRLVAAAVLSHQRLERGERAPEVRALYRVGDPELWGQVTRALGQILGDKLYYAMLRGKIGKGEIRGLFFDAFEEEGAALHTYLWLAGKVGKTAVPIRSM